MKIKDSFFIGVLVMWGDRSWMLVSGVQWTNYDFLLLLMNVVPYLASWFVIRQFIGSIFILTIKKCFLTKKMISELRQNN